MYEIIRNVINSRNYELTNMLKKIDIIWLQGDITDDQRTELIELARDNADMSHSIDILQKLEELDRGMTELSGRVTELESGETEPSDEYPEYVVGKWYYRGDKITYNGQRYVCDAPEGQVCNWSPDQYPAYWKLVEKELMEEPMEE